MMRPARVAAIEILSPHFRRIDLEGDALQDVAWAVGQKIQVAMGTGLATRTYTPMSWDTDRGRTRLLAFAHGAGPGSRWSNSLHPGDACQFFGPRRSLDLSGIEARLLLFGDETSFGLAKALRDNPQGTGAILMFEVTDIAESRAVLEALGLGDATLIERVADGTHLAVAETELARLATGGTHFILTGNASSIQRMSRSLKTAGVGSSHLQAKAYWATGKTGLD